MEIIEIIEKVFSNIESVYFWTIVFMIVLFTSKLNTSFDKIKEKVLISYLIFIILKFLNLIPISFIIFFTLILYFVFVELVDSSDNDKLPMFKLTYFLWDYLYKLLFKYQYLWFVISLLPVSYNFNNIIVILFNSNKYAKYIGIVISIIVYLHIVNKILYNKFNTIGLSEIKNRMNNIIPFEGYIHDERLEDFEKILTFYEDKSYMYRENSFNLLNLEFIEYKFMCVNNKRKNKLYQIKLFGKILKNIVTIFEIIWKMLLRILKKGLYIIKKVLNCISKKDKIYTIRSLIRGYSTIEMQLIRTIALKSGYENAFQRKIYEIIYSNIFFKSLKEYYNYHKYGNLSEFKYYLLELYIVCAPTFINGKRYENIRKLYPNSLDALEITNEEFFIYCLGLANRKIDIDNIKRYYCPICLNDNRLDFALKEVLNLHNNCYTPDKNGVPISIRLFNNFTRKRIFVQMHFNDNKSLKDVCNYLKKKYCDEYMDVYIENLKEILFKDMFSEDIYNHIRISYPSEDSKLMEITVEELNRFCNLQNKIIDITYNIGIGIGGEFAREDGIKYTFKNNEKSIHSKLPHIHCEYAGETIRISLEDFNILDNKPFKSPTRTKQAKKYVENHQEELLNYWDNVVDKDNCYNKKLSDGFYIE